jgi:hypothetical protein
MYPHERSLVKQYDSSVFAIVGVNSDPSADVLREEMKKEDLTWPSFFDGGGTSGPIATRWGVRGWPTVYVIDHKGVIRSADRGDLDAVVAKLVAEAKSEEKAGGAKR